MFDQQRFAFESLWVDNVAGRKSKLPKSPSHLLSITFYNIINVYKIVECCARSVVRTFRSRCRYILISSSVLT